MALEPLHLEQGWATAGYGDTRNSKDQAFPKLGWEDFTVWRISARPSRGTARLNVPMMLPGGSRERMRLGPVG